MNETVSPVVIETLESNDNETPGLSLKYKNFHDHGIQTLKCLDAMRKERQLCDVILMVEGHELFAHRALLSCHSNYFLELFLHDENDTTTKKQMYYQIDGLEHVALKLIIQFIYRGSFFLTPEMVPKVYLAAYQLRIETLFKACSNYLSEQLTEHNCLSTRSLAMDDDLRTKANECIQNNFTVVLETRECLTLPTIKLELIDSKVLKPKIICDLVINWIIQHLCEENSDFQELCDCMHLLYLNGETLLDCTSMDDKNIHFSDFIKDYQSYKLTKRNLSTTSPSSSQNDNFFFETPNLQINNHNLLSNTIMNSHTPETKLIHMSQSNDHSYIAIAIIKGKMSILSIHMSLSPSPTAIENNLVVPIEKTFDDSHSNTTSPILMFDKDITFGSLLTARCCFGTGSINDMIYVVGKCGYNRDDCLETIEQFDPIENKWKLLSFPMTSRRGRVSATIVDDKIYVCGGSDGQKELNTAECFDLKSMNKWSMIKELSTPVAHSAMCSDDNYVYLIGGMEGDKCKNDCYRYDPNDNSWSQLASMNTERSETGVVYCNDKIYVFGGSTLARCLSLCEILTLSTNEWRLGPTMKENRRGCGAVLYHNKIFIIGGSNGVTSLTSIEILDPLTNEWLINISGIYNELNIPRVGLGVTVCCDRIYVIGGFDGRTFLKSIEAYDENDQQWHLSYNNINQSDKNY
ncbi:unnamed protein product [Rotaria sordida]|uniref:BTB domain-containing protein n=1 Tax=Rotaria sordida TaxID=392033 RepID=A0A814SFK1_9BILA|nr:unnamed protein product [Rotaria sordida]CAF1147410.1 unnamed protein product [Rotaria sordida]CAF3503981.1 unnamed protein product [Rotaria sordida]CAF3631970.1 unnamed protein product [Rotaria sordida]